MKFEDWLRCIRPGDVQFEKQWRSKYCEWAEYIIEVDSSKYFTQLNEWKKEHLLGRCSIYHDEVYFELEEDSVLFALKWL